MNKSNFDKLEPQEKRHIIAGLVEVAVSNFMYYDRKECELMGVDDLENAIRDDIISVEEIIDLFKEQLEHNLA